MKSNKATKQSQESNPGFTGFYAQPQAFLSQDGEYLTLVLPGNMRVRKHVNFFKAILGVPFTPKKKDNSTTSTEAQVA